MKKSKTVNVRYMSFKPLLGDIACSEADPEEFSHISTNTSQQGHSSQVIIEADSKEFPHIFRMEFDEV